MLLLPSFHGEGFDDGLFRSSGEVSLKQFSKLAGEGVGDGVGVGGGWGEMICDARVVRANVLNKC